MSHVAEVGEAAISNIKELLKENQRLHAATAAAVRLSGSKKKRTIL